MYYVNEVYYTLSYPFLNLWSVGLDICSYVKYNTNELCPSQNLPCVVKFNVSCQK